MRIHYEIWQRTRYDRGIFLERDFMCFNLEDKTLAIKFSDCMKIYQHNMNADNIMMACFNDGKNKGCINV